MIVTRRLLPMALLPGLLFASGFARAQDAQSWDGIWTGVDGTIGSAPIQIAIADGKVISYTLKGAPFSIQYSNVTPTTISFGDRDHYFVKLRRTGETTATGHFHDRAGAGALDLTKEERASGIDSTQSAPATPAANH
jgi:hypothetical protein